MEKSAAGSSLAYFEDLKLIVEFYSHGKNAIYEYAKMLIFEPNEIFALKQNLSVSFEFDKDLGIIEIIDLCFPSFFEFEDYAKLHNLSCTAKTDLWP